MKKETQPLILAISGGSCSGKTTLTRMLQKELGSEACEVVYQDSYYHDKSHIAEEDLHTVNFDHPDSLEFSLLVEDLKKIKQGETTALPQYDFITRKRHNNSRPVQPVDLIIVDGILLLSQPGVRQIADLTLFVEASEELRLRRRVIRDMRERGRTQEGVLKQFHKQVKPMHDAFVEPSKKFADRILCGEDLYGLCMPTLIGDIQRSFLDRQSDWVTPSRRQGVKDLSIFSD